MAIFELGVLQVIGWYLASLTLGAATWVAYGGQHRNPQHDRELAWFLWHWFTGGPLETTRAYPREGSRPRRAAARAGTGAARTAGSVGFVATVYLQSGYGGGLRTVAAWSAAGAAALAVGTLGVTWAAMEWSMWRHYMQPLHWTVAGAAGWPLDLRWWQVRRYIKLRRRIDGLEVFVTCGPTFNRLQNNRVDVDTIVRTVCGLRNVETRWEVEGIHRTIDFVRQEPVPAKVSFRTPAIRALIEAESTSSKVLLGFTRGGEPVWLDLDKCPHSLFTSGTGGGKTAALTAVVAQLMYHGADVWVLDLKKKSHLWLRDLAGVRYARKIEEIHDLALDIGAEADRRYSMWDDVTFEQDQAGQGPKFNRLVIVCEEWSSTMDYLREYWAEIKPSGAPQQSPAAKALAKGLNMGREVQMDIFTVCQRAESNAVGSKAMMENYQAKVLIDRYSQKTWNILTDAPFKAGLDHAGRAQVCIGPDATETQILWISQADALRWVLDKRGQQPGVPYPEGVFPGEMLGDSANYGTAELAGEVPAVSLWGAAKDTGKRPVLDMTFEQLKKAAQRDKARGRFPEPIDERGRFDPRDLQRWENVRSGVIDGVDDIEGNEGDEVDRVDGIENESLAEDDSRRTWLQPESSRRDSDVERVMAGFAPPDEHGCELWTGAVSGDGYGYAKVEGRAVPVHRIAYEVHTGPIPEGHTIDHRIGPGEPCTSKLCGAEGHIQAVTNERNVELRHERDRAQQEAVR